MNKTTISLIAVIVLLAGAWYFFSYRDAAAGPAAVVNGEEITRSELDTAETQMAAQQGIDIATLDTTAKAELRTQVLDVLISQLLLRQAVADSGITASQTDIDAQLGTIRGQFETEDAFATALAAEGLTETTFQERIGGELAVQAYLNRELGLDTVTATEAEIEETYQTAVASATEEVPPLEEVRAQVEQAVIAEKQQALVAGHLQELRAAAEVEVLI